MLTTSRDRRNRRQARFTLESLDERLVLSAAGAGAVAEAAGATSARAALIQQRHEAKLERIHARHEARLARIEARHAARLAGAGATGTATTITASAMIPATTQATAVSSPATPATTTAASMATFATAPANNVTTTPTSSGASSTGSSSSSGGSSSSSGSLPANVNAALQSLYNEFESAGGGSDFHPTSPNDQMLQISGTSVAVDLKVGSSASFDSALSQLQQDGMQVTSSSSAYGVIEGMLPISALPTASQVASSVAPAPPPSLM